MTTLKPPRAKRKKMPAHTVTVRAYRFTLAPTPALFDKLWHVTGLCREVRNLLAQERAENRALNRQRKATGQPVQYLTRADQYARLIALTKEDRRLAALHSQVLQNVAHRVHEGTQRWLEAVKAGRAHVAPPGAVDAKRYNSFTYPQYGPAAHLKHGVLHLSKIGDIRVHDYRKMHGKPKSVTLKFEDGRWWVVVACELQHKDVFRTAAQVVHLPDTGIDPGLASLLTTAHGQVFDPPKPLQQALKQLRRAQRDMARKFEVRKAQYATEQARRKACGDAALPPLRELPYSNRLKKQVRAVAKRHTKVKNIRDHYHKKIARTIERSYRLVAVEEHGVQFMLNNRRLARAAADRAIHAQKQALKAVLGPRYVPTANQRPGIGGNSQTCLCDAPVPKALDERVHACPACGLHAPRDVVAANIVMKIAFGTSLLTSTAAGHAVVIRGGTEGGARRAAAGPATAAEDSMKRTSVASTRQTRPGGGEPAPGSQHHRASAAPAVVAGCGAVCSPA